VAALRGQEEPFYEDWVAVAQADQADDDLLQSMENRDERVLMKHDLGSGAVSVLRLNDPCTTPVPGEPG
jgi:hypothetical protein